MEKPRLTEEDYEYLELYLYKLVKFTESLEFLQDVNAQKQLDIQHEISTIVITLSVLKRVLNIKEEPVIAWPTDSEEYLIYYRFTNLTIASKALDCPEGTMRAVCDGKLAKAKGYYFSYEEDFELDHYTFNPKSNEFKLL